MLAPFRLCEPATLAEVRELLLAHGPGARLLAGGTALLPNLEHQRLLASVLVALPALPALRGLRVTPQAELYLGALVTLDELSRSPEGVTHWPILAATAAQMATPAVRHLATVGGNLCAELPAADLVVALLALDAEVELHTGTGPRRVALDQWLAPSGDPLLEPGEFLLGVYVPAQTGQSVYQRFSVRAAGDVVLANVAVRADCRSGMVADARIVVGAHGLRPARAVLAERLLRGQPADAARVGRAAIVAADWAGLSDDWRASRPYRQALVRTLITRAWAKAVQPA
jgi:carbon-monoxide dehydrogenase medium subunit